MPFELSKPIGKSEFLSNSKECLEMCLLAIAPFGCIDDNEDIDLLYKPEECQSYYIKWEELISRHLYRSQGLSDDKVAASFHQYFEVEKDDEVMEVLKNANSIYNRLFESSGITELFVEFQISRGKEESLNKKICSPEFTSFLLRRVLIAFTSISKACSLQERIHLSLAKTSHSVPCFLQIDPQVQSNTGIHIAIRPFSVLELLMLSPNTIESTNDGGNKQKRELAVIAGIEGLKTALVLDSGDTEIINFFGLDKNFEDSSESFRIRVSTRQYHALLAVFGFTEQVKEVLREFFGFYTSIDPLANLRIGRLLMNEIELKEQIQKTNDAELSLSDFFTCLTLNPTSQYIMQLERKSSLLAKEAQSMRDKTNHEVVQRVEKSAENLDQIIQLSRYALNLLQSTNEASEMSDRQQIITLLSKAIQGTVPIDDEDDEDDEDDDEVDRDAAVAKDLSYRFHSLSTYLQCELLVQRAKTELAILEEKQEDEGKKGSSYDDKVKTYEQIILDCEQALSLDPLHSNAHYILAQILKVLTKEGSEVCYEVIKSIDTYKSIEKDKIVTLLLAKSAKDFLSAFLLSGCTNMQAAAFAEEVAREVCRNDAKAAYSVKFQNEASSKLSTEPKDWTLRAFFMSHPPLYSVFSLDLESCLSSLTLKDDDIKEKRGTDTKDLSEIDHDEHSIENNDRSTEKLMNLKQTPSLYLLDSFLVSMSDSTNSSCGTQYRCLRPRDHEAYVLLLKLVAIFDSLWLNTDSLTRPQSDELLQSIDEKDDIDIKELNVYCSEPDEITNLDDLIKFCGPLKFGAWLTADEDINNMRLKVREGYIIDTGTLEKLPDSIYKSDLDENTEQLLKVIARVKEKSLNEVNSDIERMKASINLPSSQQSTDQLKSTPSAGPPSSSFLSAVALLSAPGVSELTGLDITPKGRIVSVKSINQIASHFPVDTKHVKNGVDNYQGEKGLEDDEITIWEDIDTDEEDDDDNYDNYQQYKVFSPVDPEVLNTFVDSDVLETIEHRQVSYALQARLLNICSSICYLAGDAIHAVECLRMSNHALNNASVLTHVMIPPTFLSRITQLKLIECTEVNRTSGPTKTEEGLRQDIRIKLGSLLTDMDEEKEAEHCLKEALQYDSFNAYALIHSAEHQIQKSNFEKAVELLSKAKSIVREQFYSLSSRMDMSSISLKSSVKSLKGKNVVDKVNLESNAGLVSAVYSLSSVSLFRIMPSNPEIAMREIMEGLGFYPNSAYMRLSLGEIYCQAGDAVAALKSFREVSVCDPLHPLPYLNAARVYQQLNQKEEARIHMEIALAVDPTLAMTRVDLAQHHLHLGNSAVALETLEGALDLARHVSEIRDVLTARTVALIQLELESEGLSFPTI